MDGPGLNKVSVDNLTDTYSTKHYTVFLGGENGQENCQSF